MNKNKQSVIGIIFSENKSHVLLTKRRDVPVWVLPGGGIESGETPSDAAIRELGEETGCQVTIKRKIAEYTPVNKLSKFTHFYECSVTAGSFRCTDETQDIKFFNINLLPTMPPPFSEWIKDGLEDLPGIIKKPISSVNYFQLFKYVFAHPILVARFFLSRLGIPYNDGKDY